MLTKCKSILLAVLLLASFILPSYAAEPEARGVALVTRSNGFVSLEWPRDDLYITFGHANLRDTGYECSDNELRRLKRNFNSYRTQMLPDLPQSISALYEVVRGTDRVYAAFYDCMPDEAFYQGVVFINFDLTNDSFFDGWYYVTELGEY